MDILLSIVVPIYKVEQYLPECLDSILHDSDDSVELILVDDGSPDNCPAICDGYAAKYSNVRVIHQANGGLAAARNAGLAVATGKYVAFVDSDDRISADAIPQILSRLQGDEFDVCFMQTIRFYPDGTQQDLGDGISHAGIAGKDKLDVMHYLASRPKFAGAAWSKIYRHAFLNQFELHFPTDGRLVEDLGFTRDCIRFANKYEALDFPYYEYRQGRAGSITDSVTEKRLQGLSLFLDESAALLTQNHRPIDEIARSTMSFVAYEYAVLLMLCRDHLGKDSAWLTYLRKNKWMMKYAGQKKTRLIRTALSVVGVHLTAKLIGMIKR